MSLATLSPADDFERFEFAALVADFTQPLGEPLPEPDAHRPVSRRRARGIEVREAIAASLDLRRRRTREREA